MMKREENMIVVKKSLKIKVVEVDQDNMVLIHLHNILELVGLIISIFILDKLLQFQFFLFFKTKTTTTKIKWSEVK